MAQAQGQGTPPPAAALPAPGEQSLPPAQPDQPQPQLPPPPQQQQQPPPPGAAAALAAVSQRMAAFPLRELLPAAPRITVVDVGAGVYSSCGADVHAPLLVQGLCDVVGFEADAAECATANAAAEEFARSEGLSARLRYFPYIIGDGSEVQFRSCQSAATSSIFEPDTVLVNKYQQLGEVMAVKERSKPLRSRTLDSVWGDVEAALRGSAEEKVTVDYIKLDIQGAELAALKGAAECLRQCVVVEVEVEFVPIYQDQPLFAEVDTWLRDQGFCFHRFTSLQGRTLKPFLMQSSPFSYSQQLWGDAVYVRSPHLPEQLSESQLAKAALIMHEVYHSYDFAQHFLAALDSRAPGRAVAPAYMARLGAASGGHIVRYP